MITNIRAGFIPYFIDEDRVVKICLMVPSDPEFGGTEPQFAKGHIENGESVEVCAIREAKEELGVTIDDVNNIWHLINYNKIGWYACQMFTTKLNQPSSESEYSFWITIDDAVERIKPWQQQILHIFWERLRKIENCYAGYDDVPVYEDD